MLKYICVYSVNNDVRLSSQRCALCSRCCLCPRQQLVFRTICLWSCWCMKCGQVMAEVLREGPTPKTKIPFLRNIRKYSVWSDAFYFFGYLVILKSNTCWALRIVEWQIYTDVSEELIASFFMVPQSDFYNLRTFHHGNVITLNIRGMFFIAVRKKQDRAQDKYSWYFT